MNGSKKEQLCTSTSNLESVAKEISSKIPEAYISYNIAKADRKVANYIRSQIKGVPVTSTQASCGWQKLNGRKIFCHDSHSKVEGWQFATGKRIAYQQIPPSAFLLIFQSVLKLAEPKILAPMFGTCLLGVLHSLFYDSNEEYAPKYVLSVIGKSGSLKTAVSKVLFSVYNTDTDSNIPASFQDTTTSLEMRFKELSSVPILVDDYYNLGNAGKKTDMQTMLEVLIRFAGDGIGKNRSNSRLENVKGERPTGTIVLTGEAAAGQHSMLLRCLTIPVDSNTFSGESLRIFQQDKMILTTLLYHFIMFLERNYDDVVEFISTNFQLTVDGYKDNFRDARPVYQFTQLYLAYSIFENFLAKLPNGIEYSRYIADCQNGCLLAVKESQDFANKNASEAQYILAFYELLTQKQIQLASSKIIYENEISFYDGYIEEEFYIVSPPKIYSKIRKFLSQQGNFTLNIDAANQIFRKADLIEVEIEQKKDGSTKTHSTKKVTINRQRTRMLKIFIHRLNGFIQSNL